MSTQVQILSGETMFLWELYPVAQFWSEDIFTEANYFENNKERMRYPKSRKQGLFVGSGVIEAGCKPYWLAQTVGNVLDRPRRQCHYRLALLSTQRQIRGLLGVAPGGSLTLKSRTPFPRDRFCIAYRLWLLSIVESQKVQMPT